MKKATLTAILAVAAGSVSAQDVYTGLDVDYTYTGFADITLPENQDRMTENVWITRDIIRGIFNAAQENGFTGQGGSSPSPIGTQWAVGSAADYQSLTFGTWGSVHGGSPPSLIGQDLAVHLVDDDIYIDLRFTAWGSGSGTGGSFAYLRSEIPGPCNIADNAMPLGVLDLSDVQGFITAYLSGEFLPEADLAEPFGVYDLADIHAFIGAFLDGCP